MNEWKLFKIDDPITYPNDEGWYYVTTIYKHPSNFIPSSTIKLSGIAYWKCNDDSNLRLGEGFETLKNDIGMMLSNNITEEVITYKKIEFPEAISDDDLFILENEYKELKQRELADLIGNLNLDKIREEDDPFSVEEVVVSK